MIPRMNGNASAEVTVSYYSELILAGTTTRNPPPGMHRTSAVSPPGSPASQGIKMYITAWSGISGASRGLISHAKTVESIDAQVAYVGLRCD